MVHRTGQHPSTKRHSPGPQECFQNHSMASHDIIHVRSVLHRQCISARTLEAFLDAFLSHAGPARYEIDDLSYMVMPVPASLFVSPLHAPVGNGPQDLTTCNLPDSRCFAPSLCVWSSGHGKRRDLSVFTSNDLVMIRAQNARPMINGTRRQRAEASAFR